MQHTELVNTFNRTRRQRAFQERAIIVVLGLCSLLLLIMLVSILWHLVSHGLSSINIDFFTHLPKPVGEAGGGMGNAIVGTLTLMCLAIVVGVPIGVGTGVFLHEYANHRFAQVVRFLADVLNGIPSIIFGIFAYLVCVFPMKSFSAFSGGIALGLMMIPMIARTTEQFVRMVPDQLRDAGMALGVPKWRVIIDLVLPSSLAGIMTGIMVSLARIAGETAPLLFTAFGNQFWNHSLAQPIAALPLQVFAYAISPFEDWHRQAWAGAMVLISIVFVINLIVFFFVYRNRQV